MAKKDSNVMKYLLIGVIVVLAGAFLISKMAGKGSDEGVVLEPRIKGNADAEVVLVEYSDLQCPACRAVFPIIQELDQEFGDELRIEYRHFPLTQIHQHAELAARATEAAGVQGKFWEMHDVLFEKQPIWSASPNPRANFISYAEDLELDIDLFEQHLNSPKIRAKILEDREAGNRAGVRGTPSFYLNGEALETPRSEQAFKDVIAVALGRELSTSTDSMMDDIEEDNATSTEGEMMEDEAMMEEGEEIEDAPEAETATQ